MVGLECKGAISHSVEDTLSTFSGSNPSRGYNIDRSRQYKYCLTAIQIAGRWVAYVAYDIELRVSC